MKRPTINANVDAHRGDDPKGPGVTPDVFRKALRDWASAVTIVAVRDGTDVHATTVTSFFPVSAEPPLIAVSLGPNAQPLPWLDPGATFAVSFLAEGQKGLAVAFADSLPVGPSPFPTDGDPVVAGAVAALVCTVREVHLTEGPARLVVGRVDATHGGGGERSLLYHRRGYRTLAPEE
jgi:flavin reductase (DIM6/NTAB) family NADH-FMN oxidoreductase RutF